MNRPACSQTGMTPMLRSQPTIILRMRTWRAAFISVGPAEYFVAGELVAAGTYDVREVRNPDAGCFERVGVEELLRPRLAVLPTGWSWSLRFCRSALADAMVAAELKRLGVAKRAAALQVLKDRNPRPRFDGAALILRHMSKRRYHRTELKCGTGGSTIPLRRAAGPRTCLQGRVRRGK
jgi:hypothetical protein